MSIGLLVSVTDYNDLEEEEFGLNDSLESTSAHLLVDPRFPCLRDDF